MSTHEEVEKLKAILHEEWYPLVNAGDEYEGFTTVDFQFFDSGRWSTYFRVVTRGPSGQHYAWIYGDGDEDEFDGDLEAVRPQPTHTIEWIKVDEH